KQQAAWRRLLEDLEQGVDAKGVQMGGVVDDRHARHALCGGLGEKLAELADLLDPNVASALAFFVEALDRQEVWVGAGADLAAHRMVWPAGEGAAGGMGRGAQQTSRGHVREARLPDT